MCVLNKNSLKSNYRPSTFQVLWRIPRCNMTYIIKNNNMYRLNMYINITAFFFDTSYLANDSNFLWDQRRKKTPCF